LSIASRADTICRYDMEFSGPFYSLVDFVRNVNALREKEIEAKEKENNQKQKRK
jgi:hypothetical protein